MKIGDLVYYSEPPKNCLANGTPMTNGIVVGFDKEHDPIVYFFCRAHADAYYEKDIEVLNESW